MMEWLVKQWTKLFVFSLLKDEKGQKNKNDILFFLFLLFAKKHEDMIPVICVDVNEDHSDSNPSIFSLSLSSIPWLL